MRQIRTAARTTLISMIMLHGLNGSPIYVESTYVEVIRSHTGDCGHGAGAIVRTGMTTVCVREKPEEILEKIKSAATKE